MEFQRLGKYEIRGILGKGAMGTVYDGYDPRIERRVAIKTMPLPDPSDEEGAEGLARFKREAQAAGRLNHPNIVGVFDYGEDESVAYIVMEYAPGTELKKILDRGDRMPVPEALKIMDAVLEGLQFSHSRGVVHRDIKPGNIILADDGTIKIADFGIARVESSQMTQAGTIMGTPAYMSPEQFMGQTVDNRSDIYSAGAMFYQLLTGERPFDGGRTAIMHKVLNTEPPRPSDLSVTSPVALDAVVVRAMAKRPEQRFESATAFAQAIRDAMAARVPAAPPPAADDGDATMVRPSARPAPAALPVVAPPVAVPPAAQVPAKPGGGRAGLFAGVAAVAVLALGAVGYFVFAGGKPPEAPPSQVAIAPTPAPASAPVIPATPAPAVPAPTASIPVVTAPAPTPAPSPEALRDAMNAALRNVPCSLASASVEGQSVVVRGVVERNRRDALVADPAAKDVASWKLDTFDEPPGARYCAVLDSLRQLGNATLAVSVRNGVTDLRKDDEIAPSVRMPNYPAWLTLDYFSNDGSVVRLHPTSAAPARMLAAGSMQDLGTLGTVDVPFGDDMIVGVTSDHPLLDTKSPPQNLQAYVASLPAAIATAQRQGIKVSVGVVVLHTRAR